MQFRMGRNMETSCCLGGFVVVALFGCLYKDVYKGRTATDGLKIFPATALYINVSPVSLHVP